MNRLKKASVAALSVALTLGVPGVASSELIVNGSFSAATFDAHGPGEIGPNGNTTITGWSSTPVASNTSGYTYNFLFAPGTLDTTGSYTPEFNAQVVMWGSNNGGTVNGSAANPTPASSPDGGNFLGADGDQRFQPGVISQTVNGLVEGSSYTLTFYWAGAQEKISPDAASGATQDQWQVSLGGQTQTTEVLNVDSHGFTGWTQATMTFTADASSDLLSFLAIGTPSGVPPFLLLDGVSLNASAVPEPSTVLMLGLGLLGAGAVRHLRRRGKPTVA